MEMRARLWLLILAPLAVCILLRSKRDPGVRTVRCMPLFPIDVPEASLPPTEFSSRPCEDATDVDPGPGATLTWCDEEVGEEEVRLEAPSVFFFDRDGTRYFSRSLLEIRSLAGEEGDVFAFLPPEETEAWSPHAHLWVLIHWDLADVYTPGRRPVTNDDMNEPALARVLKIQEKLRERIRDRGHLGPGLVTTEDERDPGRY